MPSSDNDWDFRVFFDAECPLCAREIQLIRRLDRKNGRVDLIDLSAPDFDASIFGLEQAAIEARIHGQLPSGEIIEGVDVFIHLYRAVGLGWLAAPAGWPGFRTLIDLAYVWFANNRLRLTGRAPKVCALPQEPPKVS